MGSEVRRFRLPGQATDELILPVGVVASVSRSHLIRAEVGIAYGGVIPRRALDDVVPQVEHVHAELEIDAFVDMEGFADVRVLLDDTLQADTGVIDIRRDSIATEDLYEVGLRATGGD